MSRAGQFWSMRTATAVKATGGGVTSHFEQTYTLAIRGFLVRHCGLGPEDAEDLTNSFLEKIVAGRREGTAGPLDGYDPRRGNFHPYLARALVRFVCQWRKSERSQRRGGGVRHVSLCDSETGEPHGDPFHEQPGVEELAARSFRRAFEEQVLTTMLEEYRCAPPRGNRDLCIAYLEDLLVVREPNRHVYSERFGKSLGAIDTALNRIRAKIQARLEG